MIVRLFTSTWRSRAVLAALVVLVLCALVGVGVLLADTYGTARVAANARELHAVNAVRGGAGITRAAVAQAVFFSSGDDPAAADSAIAEARSDLGILAGGILLTDPDAAGLVAAFRGIIGSRRPG